MFSTSLPHSKRSMPRNAYPTASAIIASDRCGPLMMGCSNPRCSAMPKTNSSAMESSTARAKGSPALVARISAA